MGAPACDRRKIHAIAASVRKDLGYCDLQCGAHATELAKRLRRSNCKARRVYGFVRVDGNFRDTWGRGPVDWWPQHRDIDRDLDHHWVEVGNYVIDTGAQQFNRLIRGRKFPSIYVMRKSQALRYKGAREAV